MKERKEERKQVDGGKGSIKEDTGFAAALTLMLAALKLLGIIRCGWLTVLAPLIGAAFAGIIIATVSILMFLRK